MDSMQRCSNVVLVKNSRSCVRGPRLATHRCVFACRFILAQRLEGAAAVLLPPRHARDPAREECVGGGVCLFPWQLRRAPACFTVEMTRT